MTQHIEDRMRDKVEVSGANPAPGESEIVAFVRESNRIEGILRDPSQNEIDAHIALAVRRTVTVEDLISFVGVIQPDARFRDSKDVPGVRVGDHIAPPSGPHIRAELERILTIENQWEQHVDYETLHPFTDGNGRSGRALWLQRNYGHAPIGFLHRFYYQTLSNRSGDILYDVKRKCYVPTKEVHG